ncbi:hypothetical protein GCM10027187_40920 [Streptosporangium sandarakinum]|uniref:PH domain-containing protein n=1 Tax=Streptosporangium sandarakinum TaxID=1260955 RepID=A0A852V8Y0_9ACTN|nr:hypothetical protein [Streptosporangium sandarakinum]NYF44576.1 hypothetical protein [Streptosporangium sandarakinum]
MFDFRNRRRTAAASAELNLAPPSTEELDDWLTMLGVSAREPDPAPARPAPGAAAAALTPINENGGPGEGRRRDRSGAANTPGRATSTALRRLSMSVLNVSTEAKPMTVTGIGQAGGAR